MQQPQPQPQPQQYIRYVSKVVERPHPTFNHGVGQIRDLDLFPNRDPLKTMRVRTTTVFPFRYPFGDETVEFWHNSCLAIGRKNILKLVGLAISEKDPNEVLIHTEKVTRSIFEWAERETLLTADQLLPSEAYGQVMRGILEGINQASGLNAAAGYNARAKITSKDTFLVNGVAKVSLLTEKGQCIHPLRQFTTMISDLTTPLPSELRWFLYLIDTNLCNRLFCDELPTHPSLYERSARLEFRCKVWKQLEALEKTDKTNFKAIETTFTTVQKKIMDRRKALNLRRHLEIFSWRRDEEEFKWKTWIEKNLDQNDPYHQALTPTAPAAPAKYYDRPLQFVRYCRNMAQHPGNLKVEDLESKFTNIWEDYIPCLHEALRRHKQLPKVNDKTDSIKETR